MTSAWTLDEVSDRLQIQQLLVDYATAIDTRQFDDLDEVFTNDAYIDYRAMGGIDGGYPDVKAWLAQVLPAFPMYAHMLGNISIRFDSEDCAERSSAVVRSLCFNPMVPGGDTEQVLFLGLWYDDAVVRTRHGWRLTRRVETKCFTRLV
ncbi:nuclear transport factor 2 family protein [Mycobacteroides salmoniphilum]|uniref:nuclear transport factor 2 family protein n=1 Tax=Mycobacteroides salmoniphilum TaxID=404941 RepID=UPI0009944913|nr:nuclear transport factor 2 family protein [Mycobacteroides salmoniphilum]